MKFAKDPRGRLHGFLLYREAAEISRIDKAWRHLLATTRSRTGVWYLLVLS